MAGFNMLEGKELQRNFHQGRKNSVSSNINVTNLQ